ncbi:MAG: hypothetical protein K2Y18_07765 [Alphaproteobacteria bacterium]|jgi:hypothetical protein|nr:hypothetical protein [Alphaproteobacteria bacterium]
MKIKTISLAFLSAVAFETSVFAIDIPAIEENAPVVPVARVAPQPIRLLANNPQPQLDPVQLQTAKSEGAREKDAELRQNFDREFAPQIQAKEQAAIIAFKASVKPKNLKANFKDAVETLERDAVAAREKEIKADVKAVFKDEVEAHEKAAVAVRVVEIKKDVKAVFKDEVEVLERAAAQRREETLRADFDNAFKAEIAQRVKAAVEAREIVLEREHEEALRREAAKGNEAKAKELEQTYVAKLRVLEDTVGKLQAEILTLNTENSSLSDQLMEAQNTLTSDTPLTGSAAGEAPARSNAPPPASTSSTKRNLAPALDVADSSSPASTKKPTGAVKKVWDRLDAGKQQQISQEWNAETTPEGKKAVLLRYGLVNN